jgi:CRISPR/Cas system-associated exonuclease Cas4 (RecB family)
VGEATLVLAIVLAILGAITLMAARRQSTLVASDLGLREPVTLRSEARRLVGRPDEIHRDRRTGRLYPIEVKPRRRSDVLYDSDRLQLGAYLVLAREAYGRRFAGYGIVRYATRDFTVVLTPELEREVNRIADAVRRARAAPDVHRDHQVSAKCRACAQRLRCDEALASIG